MFFRTFFINIDLALNSFVIPFSARAENQL